MSAFVGGVLSPLTVPAHVLALVALGLRGSGRQGGQRRWCVVAFVVGMSGGLAAIAFAARPYFGRRRAAVGEPCMLRRPGRDGAAPCRMHAGASARGSDRDRARARFATAGDLAHGRDHDADRHRYRRGAFAVAVIAAGVLWLVVPRIAIALRILGSWCAASAILVLALRFARGLLY